jgi:hypothetical protein
MVLPKVFAFSSSFSVVSTVVSQISNCFAGSCFILGMQEGNCLAATIDQRSPTCIEFVAHGAGSQADQGYNVSLGNTVLQDPHL